MRALLVFIWTVIENIRPVTVVVFRLVLAIFEIRRKIERHESNFQAISTNILQDAGDRRLRMPPSLRWQWRIAVLKENGWPEYANYFGKKTLVWRIFICFGTQRME